MTREELGALEIEAPSEEIYRQIRTGWDQAAKPLDGMGRFEELTARIGAILGSAVPDIGKKAVVVMCADNGIVEEGISQSGQEVTGTVAALMGQGRSSVCRLAEAAKADVIPVDIGIAGTEKLAGVLDRKIACGTKNFLKEPAMTETEALEAIRVGIDMVRSCKEQGYRLIAAGEMGIGNTTTSAAVAAALTGCAPEEAAGRGAGLGREGLNRKKQVIAEALQKYGFVPSDVMQADAVRSEIMRPDALRVLCCVGGLDIAGLAGVMIGGAVYHIPVVSDGVITAVAALVAERIRRGTAAFLLPSHKSREPVAERVLKELGLHPVIDAQMALGEGTGAVMMCELLDLAVKFYKERTTFSDTRIEPYTRWDTEGSGQ